MAFIGNTNTTQAFTPAIDYFSGNGSTTAFTLTRPVASVAQVQVVVNNVAQNPSSAFSVSGNTITFTSAPSSGTSNIYVYYTSPITQIIAPGQNTVNSTSLANGAATQIFLDSASATGTGAMKLPVGTTAQRPTGAAGLIRQNSTTGFPEWYDSGSSAWIQFNQAPAYSVNYLIAAGGAGGGGQYGGGGGAGGLLTASTTLTSGVGYTITVGAGGAASTGGLAGGSGTNSSAFSATAIGGGGGSGGSGGAAATGGSGGGGQGNGGTNGAAGTSGQGFAGGNGSAGLGGAGGGGGSAAVGASTTTGAGGAGGAGASSSINGTATNYAGGGGGGAASPGGAGGVGGGGAGGAGAAGTAGSANTGGGGGGGGSGQQGGAGGSGVVIIAYLSATQKGTGGTVTTSGGYYIHTFTSSSTYNA